jgi:pimeloyl-ACP methyl ester carboxylesterase
MPDVRCGDLDVHWEEWGSGPPIVWIPGTGLRGRTWELQIAQFRESYRCLAVDLRGSGETKGGRDGEFTVAALAWDIANWMDTIGVGEATVAGLSLGSAVAQELALARPDLVKNLVLLATWSSSSREHHIRRHFQSRLYAIENGPLDVYAQFAFWMSAPSLYDYEPELQKEVEERLASHMSSTPKGTAGHFRADLTHETRDRLHLIDCPALVVHGDEDLITLPWYNRIVADLIPDTRYAIIENAGHLAWLERPEKLNALVGKFLADVADSDLPGQLRFGMTTCEVIR